MIDLSGRNTKNLNDSHSKQHEL